MQAELFARPEQQATQEPQAPKPDRSRFVLPESVFATRSKIEQARANLRALTALNDICGTPTPAQRDALAHYSGWGALTETFAEEPEGSWAIIQGELSRLLGVNLYNTARRTALTAYYTPPAILSVVFHALRQFGFTGGQVLEPCLGTGHFIGAMPLEWRKQSTVFGCELDRTAGNIASTLYPEARIASGVGFETLPLRNETFDLVLGNVPFGDYRVYDPNHDDLRRLSIHNYFLVKSLRLLRPGGLLALVISRHYLDAANNTARGLAAEVGDCLGAIRLPGSVGESHWHTSVVTDLVFYRRRAAGERPDALTNASIGTAPMTVPHVDSDRYWSPETETEARINQLFHDRPQAIAGRIITTNGRRGQDVVVQPPASGVQSAVPQALATLPSAIYTPPHSTPEVTAFDAVEPPLDALEGHLFAVDGRVYVAQADPYADQDEDGDDSVKLVGAEVLDFPKGERPRKRLAALLPIRNAARALLDAELDHAPDDVVEPRRAKLRGLYNAFVKQHGYINSRANAAVFRSDLDWPLVSSLEENYDAGVTKTRAAKTGKPFCKPSADPAPILNQRVVIPPSSPDRVETVEEALTLSLSAHGRPEPFYMARMTGKSVDAVVEELGDRVFHDPNESGRYLLSEAYLSGDVKTKLAEAKEAAEGNARYHRNVAALESIQPADIPAVDIIVRLGAPWVPVHDVRSFVRHITGTKHVTVDGVPSQGVWELRVSNPSEAKNTTTWGTARRPAVNLIKKLLNSSPIEVFEKIEHPDGTTSRVLNVDETNAAQDKAAAIEAEFSSWLWQDPVRRERLVRRYNDTFNRHVLRNYDGSHLVLPGKVPDSVFAFRTHQKNLIWRWVQEGVGLADHAVGAGKTAAAVAALMERIRLGLSGKAMVVVPNHLTGQWAAEAKRLYPGAKVLAPTKRDFERVNRRRLFARIATGDWDLVIVAHSSFGKISVMPGTEVDFLNEEIRDISTSLNILRQDKDRGASITTSQLEKRRANLESKIRRVTKDYTRDFFMPFERMGISQLVCDESQAFKNLGASTSMRNVAGLGDMTGSQKALDLYMKSQWLLTRGTAPALYFLTGTPLSNTMAEMFTLQRYLQRAELARIDCMHFDAWCKVFGRITTDFELDATGVRYAMKTRFSRFVNVPDLVTMYKLFADTVTLQQINDALTAAGLRPMTPPKRGGRPIDVVTPRSDALASYMDQIIWRAENWSKRTYKPDETPDNMLVITNDARKAALDLRTVDPDAADDPDSKVNACVANILKESKRWAHVRGTQLVFCDLSTPKASRSSERTRIREIAAQARAGDQAAIEELERISPDEVASAYDNTDFSVYEDIRDKLIAGGLLPSEIAFIHDASTELQKQDLFDRVNSGQVRVLIGSTSKMGVGTNVQERVVAAHHLDCPWRPSDLEQRDGRVERQGNALYEADPDNFTIAIYRYAVERTYDARMWQTVESKLAFILQLRLGVINERECVDIAAEAANAADLKAAASGNPLILEEVQLRAEIRRLEGVERNFVRDQHYAEDTIATATRRIGQLPVEIAVAESAVERLEPRPAHFRMEIDGTTYDLGRERAKPKKGQKAPPSDGMLFNTAATAIAYDFGSTDVGPDRLQTLGTYCGVSVALRQRAGRSSLGIVFDLGNGNIMPVGHLYLDGKPVGRKLINRIEEGYGTLVAFPDRLRDDLRHQRAQLAEYQQVVADEWPERPALEAARARHRVVIGELQKQAAGKKTQEARLAA